MKHYTYLFYHGYDSQESFFLFFFSPAKTSYDKTGMYFDIFFFRLNINKKKKIINCHELQFLIMRDSDWHADHIIIIIIISIIISSISVALNCIQSN